MTTRIGARKGYYLRQLMATGKYHLGKAGERNSVCGCVDFRTADYRVVQSCPGDELCKSCLGHTDAWEVVEGTVAFNINVKYADQRQQKGCWSPGNYRCTCTTCGETFRGDKRKVSPLPRKNSKMLQP